MNGLGFYLLVTLKAQGVRSLVSDREARVNLVTSLVAGIAGVSGLNGAMSAGAAKIEVENNQVSLPDSSSPPPPWLAGLLKLPGYKGEPAGKGDGVIADPVTELDPAAKSGLLILPLPDAKTLGDWNTAIIPDQAKGLVDYVFTMAGYNPNEGAVGNMKQFFDSLGFGSEVQNYSQKTNQQIRGQTVYKATSDIGNNISKGDLFYLDGTQVRFYNNIY